MKGKKNLTMIIFPSDKKVWLPNEVPYIELLTDGYKILLAKLYFY